LRGARERLGWSLEAVSAALRIRAAYLAALEAGRIDLLPGNAYAVGFLRTYAAALGLDAAEMCRRFKAEAAEVTRKTELAFPAPMPERGVPAGAVIFLGVVLAVGAYVGWYRLSGDGRLPPETVPPVPAHLAPLAEQALPPAPAPVAPQSAPPTAVVSAPPPAPVEDVTPQPSISPSSAAAAPVPLPPVPAPPPAATAAPTGDQPRIVLLATADAWLQVRDRSGTVLLNKVLHASDTWPVPPRTDLLLTTGNAGGTTLVVDGVNTPPLGVSGSVRRDLPLDVDAIKDGKLAPPGASPAQPVSARTPAQ
jgi:cytoskeleton protein RodZ